MGPQRLDSTVEGNIANNSHLARPRNPSSHIDSFSYNHGAKELTVTFRGDRSYTYRNVPPEVFENMAKDHSAGKYFHQVVKRHYRLK
jgi:hypothetical protein